MLGMIVALIAGLLIGGLFGIITLGLMIASGRNREDEMEENKNACVNNTISWEEFSQRRKDIPSRYQDTNIVCPNCGKLLCRDTLITLASIPPQSLYVCLDCGWKGSA